MAPLNFSDNIGLYSLIGTWLGRLFTLLGLLAVISQLQSLLKDFTVDRKERARNAAGDWSVCLLSFRQSDTGLLEAKAPPVSPWFKNHYNNNSEISVCPYERKKTAGQSSWSRLFARLQIQLDELLQLNDIAANPTASGKGLRILFWNRQTFLLTGRKYSMV
jgi:hypothetical protein